LGARLSQEIKRKLEGKKEARKNCLIRNVTEEKENEPKPGDTTKCRRSWG
jgi:hypothetical protein